MKIIHLITGILLFAFSLDAQDSNKEKVFLFVGHRGASYLAPEYNGFHPTGMGAGGRCS